MLPELIRGHPSPHGFDLCGTAIGTVALDAIVTGRRGRPATRSSALPSSGLHSNGYTLARRALLVDGGLALDDRPPELGGATVADALLEPTVIYVRAVLELLRSGMAVHGLAHITGGGLRNLLRLGADRVGYAVEAPLPVPAVFGLIARLGAVAPAEMWDVFNMGCGFVAVVPEARAADAAALLAARHPARGPDRHRDRRGREREGAGRRRPAQLGRSPGTGAGARRRMRAGRARCAPSTRPAATGAVAASRPGGPRPMRRRRARGPPANGAGAARARERRRVPRAEGVVHVGGGVVELAPREDGAVERLRLGRGDRARLHQAGAHSGPVSTGSARRRNSVARRHSSAGARGPGRSQTAATSAVARRPEAPERVLGCRHGSGVGAGGERERPQRARRRSRRRPSAPRRLPTHREGRERHASLALPAGCPRALEVGPEGLDDRVRAQVDREARHVEAGDRARHVDERLGGVELAPAGHEALAQRSQVAAVEPLLGRRLDRQAGGVRRARRRVQPEPRVHRHAAGRRRLEHVGAWSPAACGTPAPGRP